MQTIPAKTIVSGYFDGGWFGSNYNMNLYRGCCHGCIYCDSRSDCYRIEQFDQVRVKENALGLLERDLRAKRRTGTVLTGSMSDPYNPFEKDCEITRGALGLLARYRFGVAVLTKSDLVLRDIDLFRGIKAYAPAVVSVTVTTLDDTLCQKIEPNVASTKRRFEVIRQLSAAGIMTGVLMMPILPFLNDSAANIKGIVETAAACGARYIYPAFSVTLRDSQRAYFYDRLDMSFPGVRARYIRAFGTRYECGARHKSELWNLFRAACTQHGLLYAMPQITRMVGRPYQNEQLSLF